MPRSETDRNLLFGILALQMDFIRRDDLISVMNAWVLAKHRSIGDILIERELLDFPARDALERMVDLHIAHHGDDPTVSLAALSSIADITADLQRAIEDTDLQDSLATASPGRTMDLPAAGTVGIMEFSRSGLRFRKVRDHAKGGLGIVFVARDEELNREVALKEIQDRHADDPISRSRFLMEAEITGGLEHPGIVPVYGLGHYEDGRPFYAMRFIKGDSLKEAIGRFHSDKTLSHDPGKRALLLQKLIRRFLDVCDAVAYAHSRGILHRDLKPDNVMVGRFGETLVVDWGLAKAIDQSSHEELDALPEAPLRSTSASGSAETMPGSVIGTPAYMSPEQAAGRLELLGPRSDVYSLGATLYSLLTGRAPFGGTDILEVLRKVEHGEFPPPREVSPWLDLALEKICLKAMAVNPEDRYGSPQTMADDLERCLADEPVTAYSEPVYRQAKRWARKHRTGVATAGSSVTVALLLLGAITGLRGLERQKTDEAARAMLAQAEILGVEARTTGDLTRGEKAIAEALRARERLESGGGSAGLRQEAKSRLGVLQNEQVRRRESLEVANKDRQVVDALEEARLQEAKLKDGHFDDEAKQQAFLAAFRTYGIDLETMSVEDSAKRIRSSAVADDLVSALDDWDNSNKSMNQLGDRIMTIARLADPDPVRTAIREALARRDASGLRHFCERPEDRRKLGSRLRLVFKALVRLDPEGSFPLLESIRRERPSDFWINHDLGMAYKNAKPPQLQDALRCLSAALAIRPESPGAHLNLGTTLLAKGDIDGGEAEYRIAIQLHPNYAEAHSSLGNALRARGDLDGAISKYRDAIRLKPDDAGARSNLGVVLKEKGDIGGSIDELRDAIRANPNLAEAHSNYGLALAAKGEIDNAIAEYQTAIRLKPDLVNAHYNLGHALKNQAKYDEAITEYREALRLDPREAEAHTNLGLALLAKGDIEGAISEYRNAIRIKPGYAIVYNNLAEALRTKGVIEESIAAYREAIRIDPKLSEPHYNLALALQTQGDLDEAEAEYRTALRISPDDAETLCNLGMLVQRRGRFAEALGLLERGHELGSKKSDWRYSSAQWVNNARRLVEMESKLPALMKGEIIAKDATERLILADLCLKKLWYASAARFFGEAFAEKPALADDLRGSSRYNAACVASLAGSGQGNDDPKPDEAARLKLRDQALQWLRADLASWTKILEGGNEPARKQAVLRTLNHWKQDSDLAAIRDEEALSKLAEAERESCRALWKDVEALRKKAAGEATP